MSGRSFRNSKPDLQCVKDDDDIGDDDTESRQGHEWFLC